MVFARSLSTKERSKILSLRRKGSSIFAISRELHRSRATVSKFIKNPEEYIKNIKKNVKLSKSYEKLNKSLETNTKTNKKKSDGAATTPKKSQSKLITSTPNKKIIPKNYDISKQFSIDEIKRFNRVTVEHRAVIKYLIKKGIGPRFVYEEIQKVYESTAPDLQSTLYWAKQFQQGRQTLVNEPANKTKLLTSPSSPIKMKLNTNTSKRLLSSKSPVKQVKLFKFKFKPVKRLSK